MKHAHSSRYSIIENFPVAHPPILYNICSIPKLLPQVQVLRALRLRGLPNQRYLAAASVSCAKVQGSLNYPFEGYQTMQMYGTPRKTNMSPENQWLEDVFLIEIVPF